MVKQQIEKQWLKEFPSSTDQGTAAQSSIDVKLQSVVGIDYTLLRDLLQAQNFRAADHETYLIMIKVMGCKEGDWIRNEEFLNFPCVDLKTINRLWVIYSRGRFGFSVQNHIYAQCGAEFNGQYPGDRTWKKFGERVGWCTDGSWIDHDNVEFTILAPQGHLPICGWWLVWQCFVGSLTGGVVSFPALAAKLAQCQNIQRKTV